jgi:hypothetical protein
MKASDVSFSQILIGARNNPELGLPAGYIQVEYGLKELEACWDGFAHTSDEYDLTFKSRKEIYTEFTDALNDYIDYLGESAYLKMGSKVSWHSRAGSPLE